MIEVRQLNCGAKVIMEKMDCVQSAAIGIWFKTGAVNEPKEYAGISHYIEHMMFKGTDKRSAREIAESMDKIGGQMNAFTSKEVTCYYAKTTTEHVMEGLDILTDMVTNSNFSEIEMDRERNVIIEEMKMSEDTPDDVAHDMIIEAVHKGTALENSIIGTRESLHRIDRDVIMDYYKNQYTIDSTVACVVGNFDEEAVCEMLEERLSKLKAHKEAPILKDVDSEPSFQVKIKDIEQSHVFLGKKGLPLDTPEYYNLSILTNILGGNMSSRLFQTVREEKGLAYAVYSVTSASTFAGNTLIYAGVAHDKIEDAIEAIIIELDKIKNGEITQEELDKAKEQLKTNYIFGLENPLSKMMSIGRSYILLNRIRTDEEVLREISKVTLEDVNRLAAEMGDIRNYSAVAVTNKDIDLEKIVKSRYN